MRTISTFGIFLFFSTVLCAQTFPPLPTNTPIAVVGASENTRFSLGDTWVGVRWDLEDSRIGDGGRPIAFQDKLDMLRAVGVNRQWISPSKTGFWFAYAEVAFDAANPGAREIVIVAWSPSGRSRVLAYKADFTTDDCAIASQHVIATHFVAELLDERELVAVYVRVGPSVSSCLPDRPSAIGVVFGLIALE